jgi:hypothetical protein
MELAHTTDVQDVIDGMVETAQHYMDVAKRDMDHIYSITTQQNLAMFGEMAEKFGGMLSAFVGAHFVCGFRDADGNYVNSTTASRVQITIRFRDLESFKDEKLISILETIDTMGLEAETRDYTGSESPNREFRFETNDYRLVVDAWVKSDSPLCRRIKTGETIKTVVEEKWDIECD